MKISNSKEKDPKTAHTGETTGNASPSGDLTPINDEWQYSQPESLEYIPPAYPNPNKQIATVSERNPHKILSDPGAAIHITPHKHWFKTSQTPQATQGVTGAGGTNHKTLGHGTAPLQALGTTGKQLSPHLKMACVMGWRAGRVARDRALTGIGLGGEHRAREMVARLWLLLACRF